MTGREGAGVAQARELAALRARLTEALEQQAAAAEILRIISSSPTDIQPVFDMIVRSAVRLCGGAYGTAHGFDGHVITLAAHYNCTPEVLDALRQAFPRPPDRQMMSGRAILTRAVVHVEDLLKDPDYAQHVGRAGGFRGVLAVPMLRDGHPIGAIVVIRAEPGPFSAGHIQVLKTFADQAVIAIENVRLFTALEARNHDLTEALDQRTATAEILRVISSSPTDIQPVFDIIAESAVRLCDAEVATVTRYDGEWVHIGALYGSSAAGIDALRRTFPMRPSGAGGAARAIRDRAIAHIPDVLKDDQYQIQGAALTAGFRSVLGVPMLREGKAIGAITLGRAQPGEYTAAQIQLLRTFADQALVAIENVRLFTELEIRNRDLTEALEQQTATSDVLKVISRSTFDLRPVLESLIESAVRLCAADKGFIYQQDGDLYRMAVAYGESPDFVEVVRRHPHRAGRESATSRVLLERGVIHIHDAMADPEYRWAATERGDEVRTVLGVPMLREGIVIGVFIIRRAAVRPFSDKQIELVRTFADQAVIAIENVRLFTALEARNRDLTETLEQQTATSEILRVISSSPTDVRPVFDTIVRNARRLCETDSAAVLMYDGELIRMESLDNASPERATTLRQAYPMPATRGHATGRAILTGRPVHIPDVREDIDFALDTVREAGISSVLSVPLVRDGTPIGAITVHAWVTPRPFSDKQIALLQTFADQAVIAIENVRLFRELEARNRDLTETLEQQTATGEILRVISSSPTDARPVFDTIARSARRLCEAEFCQVFRLESGHLHWVADDGHTPEGLEAARCAFPRVPERNWAAGRAVVDVGVVHIEDVQADPDYALGAVARAMTFRSVVAVPILRERLPIGAIAVARPQAGAFPDRQIELLKTFADQAVIAIENVRLFKELEARNAELTGTLARQTATGEVLRAISRAQTDAQPVFDIIAASALRLCGGGHSGVWLYDGELIHLAALENVRPEGAEAIRHDFPRPADRRSMTGRAILGRTVIQVPDVLEDPAYVLKDQAKTVGYRSFLSAPMLKGGDPIGAIGVGRPEPGPFPESQVDLLRTFADQAVIAIENVRLFTALEARNRDLSESLERQTATSEVLKVISRSAFDLQPVLEVLAENATRLCAAGWALVYRFDGDVLRVVASYGAPAKLLAWLSTGGQGAELRPGRGSVTGRAAVERRTVHIVDVLADPEFAQFDAQSYGGNRAALGVPMLREGSLVGVFFLARSEPRPFTDDQIELVTTFADQAVIAIENVRLFQELEARNRDLIETLEQQTATSEVLRVISGSPTDVQPVFDTIARNAARLCQAQFCFVYRYDGQLLHFVAHHGVTIEGAETVRRKFPAPPSRGSAAARAILDGDVAQIPDVTADADFALGATATTAGYRSALAVPMLRDGVPIGSIAVARSQSGLLPERQIGLLKTFADQAVIAIENVRLFRELEARTQDLTHSVDELRALSEVSQAVSSTLDLETVLATIVSRAIELSGSYSGLVYEFDESTQRFHVRATHQITPDHLAAVRAAPIRLGEGAVGRAGVSRAPVQVADIAAERQLVAPQVRDLLLRQELRSLLALPLVRDERLLGGLVIIRREKGAFSPEVVATMQTFAAQSVLAMHNAGLFRETQRQKQYSDALVQTSPVAIVTMDLGSKVVGWNPGAERLFGYAQAEALGRLMEDLVGTPESRDEVRSHIQRTLDGDQIRAIGRRARKDGTLVDVEISSVPVVVDGAKMGMIANYHDITELLSARREAEAANEAKSAFLATMSHEIRTPLNAVIGMSGLLLTTTLTDEQREFAEIVRQSGDALLTVINDILDFSKIEAGRLELESQPFDLRDCVEGALDLVATRAAEKGLDLAYVVGDGTPAAVVGDVTRLRQVLLNLLSNAVKFTERGEVVLSVSARPVDGAATLHELTFSVRDTGIGIPADRLGRLFQSFSQVDASTTRRYGGTGLGLAISQRLTELMGSRIEVTSEVGTGSDFRFTIRAAAAELVAAPRRDLSGIQPSLRGKRVLVVDDNATNRRILTTHLNAWGMESRASESPLEALGWIQDAERFDLGILDMHMPEMDGVGLARAIREAPAGAALPLVLFTSLGRREARAESEGFAAYLHKPIKPSQLFDALVSVLADQPVHVRERAVVHTEIDTDLGRRRPLRILLAEDNVVNQKVAIRLLAQMGYRADVAANGLEAIEAVARQVYDVVLMDVQMPELDGFEASREINRRWTRENRPRIVAMTANALQGDRELCTAAGMDDYVAKPIRVEDLVGALERCPRRPEVGTRGGTAGVTTETGAPRLAGPSSAGPGTVARGPSSPGESAAPAIDRPTLDRLAATMGGEFVAELIDTFMEDARHLIATLRGSFAGTDLDAFRRAAHSLKSTSETVGATGLAGLARELEAMARAGRLDGVGDRLDRLAHGYETVARTLKELRRDLSA